MTRTRMTVLGYLGGDESRRVLDGLLAAHPGLRDEAEQLATQVVTDVDVDEVAEDVVWTFLDQSFTDIGLRAGRQPGRGYVHEADAQWELLEEALAAHTDEVVRLAGHGFEEAARGYARGIVAALRRLRDEADDDTLIGWGDVDENASGLEQSVTYACKRAGIEDVGLDHLAVG